MSLDATFRPLATRLLRTLSGRQITYKRATTGTAYDPDTSTAVPGESSSTVYAYADTPSRHSRPGQILRCDVVFLISAEQLGFEPTPGDEITDGGVDYTVPTEEGAGAPPVRAISSGLQDALYIVAATRG